MTEHSDIVERQRLVLEAEQWAKGMTDMHVHRLNSMWYDDRPQDTEKGMVTDIRYNSGIIERFQNDKLIHTFGQKLKGEALLDAYTKGSA